MAPPIQLLKLNIAQRCLGTALRGAQTGSTDAAIKYLFDLDFHIPPGDFSSWLDSKTDQLVKTLPEGKWGHARKALNLFLRDCLYARWRDPWACLDDQIDQLEVPLDSFVGKGIHAFHLDLPSWGTIKDLTPELSHGYQVAAQETARQWGTYRVHLDLAFWRSPPQRLLAEAGWA